LHIKILNNINKSININGFLIACLGFALLIVSFYGNIIISGMSISGAVSSSLGLLLIIYSFSKNNIIGILVFFLINGVIGPFSLINLHNYGFDTIGRLDYLFAIFLFSYYIFINKKINIFIFLLLLLTSATYFLHQNFTNIVNTLTYGYISIIVESYVIFIILKNYLLKKGKGDQGILLKLVIFIFIVNITLAYLQIFITGLHIRQEAHIGQTVILGFFVNRPTGLYGSAYVFSLATLFYGYIIFILLNVRRRNDFLKILYIFVFPLIFLSSSAVGLGVFSYFFIFLFFTKLSKQTKLGLILLFIATITLIFINFHISDFNKSTGTKLLMWWLIIQDIFNSSNLLEVLFGHGVNTSKFVSLQIPEFLDTYEHGYIFYDHEILKRDGAIYPHNIFIQIFYEFGILMFLLISIVSIRNLIFIMNYKYFSIVNMLFIVAIVNYSFHNGIFSITLLIPLLMIAYARKYKNYKLLI
jgi:hypothetical protein